MLNVDGTMFIEDVQKVEDFDQLQSHFEFILESCEGEYESESVDLRYVKDRYDDLIFAIKRIK